MAMWRKPPELPDQVPTEQLLQIGVYHNWLGAAQYMMANICYALGEADMLMIRRSGYVEEFEVKITRGDFLADRKKLMKHQRLQAPNGWVTPNKFSYVVPKAMVKVEEVPEYAGLFYWCPKSGYIHTVKAPKFLHKDKHDWTAKIAKSASHRLMRLLMRRKLLKEIKRENS